MWIIWDKLSWVSRLVQLAELNQGKVWPTLWKLNLDTAVSKWEAAVWNAWWWSQMKPFQYWLKYLVLSALATVTVFSSQLQVLGLLCSGVTRWPLHPHVPSDDRAGRKVDPSHGSSSLRLCPWTQGKNKPDAIGWWFGFQPSSSDQRELDSPWPEAS